MSRRSCPPQGCDDPSCNPCYQDAVDEEIYHEIMRRSAERQSAPEETGDPS